MDHILGHGFPAGSNGWELAWRSRPESNAAEFLKSMKSMAVSHPPRKGRMDRFNSAGKRGSAAGTPLFSKDEAERPMPVMEPVVEPADAFVCGTTYPGVVEAWLARTRLPQAYRERPARRLQDVLPKPLGARRGRESSSIPGAGQQGSQDQPDGFPGDRRFELWRVAQDRRAQAQKQHANGQSDGRVAACPIRDGPAGTQALPDTHRQAFSQNRA